MSLLSQSHRLGSGSWVDAFPSRAGNLNNLFGDQSLPQSELLWGELLRGQLEPDNAPPDNFRVVYFSPISASPEAIRLWKNLREHPHSESTAWAVPSLQRTSILDFPRLNLGTVLRPLSPDDDLLGEMLNEAWP